MVDVSESPLALLDDAFGAFTTTLLQVPDAGWSRPTPCTEWSVRDLVNHVVAEHLWAPHLLHGETIDDVGDRYDSDVVGGDPLKAWTEASRTSADAWRALPSGDITVHLSFGDVPATEYAEQMLTDLVVHRWDLARGAGLDGHIGPRLAEHVLAYVEPQAKAWHDAGAFGEPVDIDSDDPGVRLIGLTGRRP